nr:cyclophilin-like fold protein [Klebsiella pneumoniae]
MKKYKVVTAGLLLAGLIATGITWAAGQSNGEKNAQWRKPLNESITLRFGEKAYSVDLYDNPTTHDLLKKLPLNVQATDCLLYTSDAADERSSVDLGGRRIIKK